MGALRFFLIILAVWLGCGPAKAERRVALLIGNSAYKNVARLTNPVNDAALLGGMFKKVGFDAVDIKLDLNAAEMRRALRDFGDKTRDADVAVIYYAGHGIELDGNNYLIPIDAMLERDSDVLDETIALDRALFAVEPAKQLRLVILDACRDNPFARSMKRTIASRAIGRGLAKIEPTSPNTVIAFAAKAGSTASDGDSKNSPFAAALVERLPTPGLDLGKAFRFVRDDVLKSTGNKQEPYVYGSLGGDDVALVPAKPVKAPGPQANPQDSIRRDYELALQAGNRDAWEAFLQAYPDGFYAGLARAQLKNVAAEEARAAAAAKARQAEDERARLAAERANRAEQEKAAAAAKAAENARVGAEKAKQVEEAKAAAAEQRRKDAEAAVAKALADKIASDKTAAELAVKQAADVKAREGEQKAAAVAATSSQLGFSPQGTEQDKASAERARFAEQERTRLSPEKATQAEQERTPLAESKLAALPSDSPASLSGSELVRSLQQELKRVGCLSTMPSGEWTTGSERSLALFNKHAGTRFDIKLASADALDAIRSKTGRICPLICETGYRADGDRCSKVACRAGYRMNDEGVCQKVVPGKPLVDGGEQLGQRERTTSRAAAAYLNGTYRNCMGATPGCFARATSASGKFPNDPEGARRWCTRQPTC